MEYCCNVWASALTWFLDMLDKLQKWICRTVGPSLTASLEPLALLRNAASLVHSIGITSIDVHLHQLNWFLFPHSRGRSTCYDGRSRDISLTVSRY